MELIENLLQLLVTFVGALLSGISYRKSRRQAYFLLLCFYGCFAPVSYTHLQTAWRGLHCASDALRGCSR